MKKLSSAIVRIKNISFSQPLREFPKIELEKAARLILEIKGVITPPILFRTDLESYTLIDGEFEYQAALKAMTIDDRKGKTINAYIVDSEEEKVIYQKQIQAFRQRQAMVASPVITEIVDKKDEQQPSLEKTVNQLVSKIDALENTSNQQVSKIESLEKTVNQQVSKSDILELKTFITTLLTERTPIQPEKAPAPLIFESTSSEQKPVSSIDEERKIIEDINTLSLQDITLKFDRLIGVRRKSEVVEFIIQKRQEQVFLSRNDMKKRAKGSRLLGDVTLNKIFNQWV